MMGYILNVLEALVLKVADEEKWAEILQVAPEFLDSTKFRWNFKTNYDDKHTFKLIGACSDVLKIPMDDLLEAYGVFFLHHAMGDGWGDFLKCLARDLHEFLDMLSSMHFFIVQVAYQSPRRGPSYKCEARPDGSLRLHYHSLRPGLYPIVKGLVLEVGKVLFGMDLKCFVTERNIERRGTRTTEHVVFTVMAEKEGVAVVSRHEAIQKPLTQEIDSQPVQNLDMSVEQFCQMFPSHVCVNRNLVLEHCGNFLYYELDLAKRRSTKLADLFTCVQPDDVPLTFKSIQTYINSTFVLQLKQPLKRNTEIKLNKDGKEIKRAIFALKGMMKVVNNGNNILFMGSPYITSVQQLMDANLFINDFQRHDANRDLIMLNQSRLSQQEINKKLEDSLKKMQRMTDELGSVRNQMSLMYKDCMPASIAEEIHSSGQECLGNVEAQEFRLVSVLQCDLPHFPFITTVCDAREVVNLIAVLFSRYDRLIELYKCYKVVSLMDNYFVLAGVPEQQQDDADRIFNLAIGMMAEAKNIKVPKLNLPLLLRITIHSGPVVAGMIGSTKVRYSVMGETVNLSKYLRHHGQAGKILVTSTAKQCARKDQPNNQFVFSSRGSVNVGHLLSNPRSHSINLFNLEKNSKKTVWDILHKQRDAKGRTSEDGYAELNSLADIQAWAVVERGARKEMQTKLLSQAVKYRRLMNGYDRVNMLRDMYKKGGTKCSSDSGISNESTGSQSVALKTAVAKTLESMERKGVKMGVEVEEPMAPEGKPMLQRTDTISSITSCSIQ
ncbi:heme NO binding associated domain-containing protein [Ditylenchus destructor]|nr:heme NO binding associated domain-containing protein [Ditylenchus destructor]